MTVPTVISLGCRLNIAESEAIRAQLGDRAGDRPLIVINSCAVTGEAVRQTRQAIRRQRRENPGARLIVTGCAAQLDPQAFAAMPEVDRVLGNREKALPRSFDFSAGDARRVMAADIMAQGDAIVASPSAFTRHSRGFVAVQTGCDHRCTFCTIPFARGPSRSVPAGEVISAVNRLIAGGTHEIVLTGVDVTSYGHDLPGQPTLGLLVERLLAHCSGLERLRLSSLDGVEIDERLLELIGHDARIMPHVHLSLQSGSDMILKRMKRRHSRVQAIALVEKLHKMRSEIAIGADLIAGFPTEDSAMHRDNLAILRECRVVHSHIFPFSPRSGTPAARMPQLDGPTVKQRAAELRAEAQSIHAAWLTSLIGKPQRVLAERGGNGHAENFAVAALPQSIKTGEIVEFIPKGVEGGRLTGDIRA